MYCRNCGVKIDPNAAFCVKCGYAKGTGTVYCENCGHTVNCDAVACLNCGYPIPKIYPETGRKSRVAAGLFGIFLGTLGIHNFYLGYTGKAVAQLLISLLTCGVGAIICSIWGLIEGILILTGGIDKDAKGVPLKD